MLNQGNMCTKTTRLFLSCLLLLNSTFQASASSSSLDKPFQNEFKRLPQSPCVSLMHRNGRVGCGTYSHDTMTGTLLHWSTLTSSTDYYTNLEPTLPSFVAVVDESEFSSDTVDELMAMNTNTKLLQGILVINSTITSSSSYTNPASTTPRGENTPSYQLTPAYDYEWNTNGNNLLDKDMYGVPTSYVTDDEISEYMLQIAKEQSQFLLSSANQNNNDNGSGGSTGGIFSGDNLEVPSILAEFTSYMGPEGADTQSCLSWIDNDGEWRPKCLPLGGNSVWAQAGSPPSASNDDDGNNNNNDETSVILVATNLDSTSMFHEMVPGANSAASNILTLLMAAKLLGESVDDDTLDNLNKKIVFAFFQGEEYGYLGSRAFLKDLSGFQCDDGRTVPTVSKKKDDENYAKTSCLSPLRHDLGFTNLGDVSSMIAVDQVGILSDDTTFYVHYDSDDDNDNDNGLLEILLAMSSDDWTVSEGNAGSVPPSPLSSLRKISGGNAGGVVLSGYDTAFVNDAHYLSHLDSRSTVPINLDAIAKAATFVARAALQSAYNGYYDDANVIEALSSDDETLIDLSNCLFTDGKCDTLKKFTKMERVNSRDETGADVGIGQELGKPPNYYVSIFDGRNGQAYAYIGGNAYGSYTGDEEYGKDTRDAVLIKPNFLEMGIYGLLNDFLGRGTNGDDELTSCQSSSDCKDVAYCSNTDDSVVCSGNNVCVCSRSHYHFALDEAIMPAPNNLTGWFLISDYDEGISPTYAEPYWDNNIGIRVYRDSVESGGFVFSAGIVMAGAWIASIMFIKNALRKEKLY